MGAVALSEHQRKARRKKQMNACEIFGHRPARNPDRPGLLRQGRARRGREQGHGLGAVPAQELKPAQRPFPLAHERGSHRRDI